MSEGEAIMMVRSRRDLRVRVPFLVPPILLNAILEIWERLDECGVSYC